MERFSCVLPWQTKESMRVKSSARRVSMKTKMTANLRTVYIVSLITLTLTSHFGFVFACPKDCFCAPHSKNVMCANKGFTYIPSEIPEDTVELILNENKFTNTGLTRRNFTALTEVKELFLSDCGIETVAVDTFVDLSELQRLDISRNKIRFLADFTFRGLNLKHLNINGNMGLQLSIGAFVGMTTQGLYVQNCGLRSLPVDLMNPLNGSLKILWLHGNNFESFSEKWLHFFRTLGHIRLGGNSFHCNCELHWLYAFYKSSKNSLFSAEDVPACGSPTVLKGRNFDELTDEDFRCELPTFQNVDAVFDSKMAKLSCSAKGDPAPTLYWVRPDGTTEKFYPRDSHNNDKMVSGSSSVADARDVLTADERQQTQGVLFLTGVKLENKENYRCVASNPAGNVTFSLNVVWPDLVRSRADDNEGTGKDGKDYWDSVGHIIRDDMETTRTPGAILKNYVGDDSGAYGGLVKSSGGGSHFERKSSSVRRAGGRGGSPDGRFNTVDIVGAVMGTFALTLVLCVTVFYLYNRRRRQLRREEHHYSVPDQLSCPHHGPHQHHPFPMPHHPLTHPPPPVSVYVMGEGDDNTVKMINHPNGFECLS